MGATDNLTTLTEYVERMKEGQKKIYYVSGTSKEAVQSSPVLEGLKKQGFEIIYALDQIDEVSLSGVGKYKEHEVVDAAKGDVEELEESDEAKNANEVKKAEFKDTTEFIKDTLGDKVSEVIVSSRLTESPSALTTSRFGESATMRRLMKERQATDDPMRGSTAAPNLEINPDHEVVKKLKAMIGEDGAAAYANLLFDVAATASGYEVEDTGAFSKRIIALMEGGPDALLDLGEEAKSTEEAPADEKATSSIFPEADEPEPIV